jgi:hypothetical protein
MPGGSLFTGQALPVHAPFFGQAVVITVHVGLV